MTWQGIILAGGRGTRLLPLTRDTNKHLLPVGGKPMISHVMNTLAEAGVQDVVVVTNCEYVERFEAELPQWKPASVDSLRVVGQAQPGGIAQALACAESAVRAQRLCVLLGDNLFGGSIAPMLRDFEQQPDGARVLLTAVDDVHDLGEATLEGQSLVRLEEKPRRHGPGLAVTGAYCYHRDVFDVCRLLQPSERGELEITDVNRRYLKDGTLAWSMHAGWWLDVGTHEGLAKARARL